MAFAVSITASYIVLFAVLITFTILAAASADYFHECLPYSISRYLVLIPNKAEEGEGAIEHENANRTADFFLSARNSASYWALAMSYFAGGMGAWVVYGTTEMGANPQLSWLGVLGYSMASAVPALIVCAIGPKIKALTERSGDGKAFSCTDFTRIRYGRVMQLVSVCLSIFYMFIFLVAEMTSISNVYALLVGKDLFEDSTTHYMTTIAVSIGVITIFYTGLAGLPGSIITDKVQGVLMGILVIILTLAVTTVPQNRVTPSEFALASNWTLDGFMAAITLFIAIAAAEMFNQGTWQRVWAAKSIPDLRKGFMLGSFLVFLLMFFFGIMGMIAYAKDPMSYDTSEKYAYLAFFDLIEPLKNAWHIIVLILVTALCASTVDTLQNALASFLSSDLIRFIGPTHSKIFSRFLVILINIPAIVLSAKQYGVISLFLVADLVCATSVLPVFLGLITQDIHFLLPAPTELGALLGCITGIVTVIVNGVVLGANTNGLFSYFWLDNQDICALCGSKTMTTFIITPLFSGIATLIFSRLDVLIRKEKARRPLIHCAFDKKVEEDIKEDVSVKDVDVDVKNDVQVQVGEEAEG